MSTSNRSPLAAAREPGSEASREEIEHDIERTREHLGSTVEALKQRLDVKSRLKAKLAATRTTLVGQARAHQPMVVAMGAALILTTAGLVVWRVRR